MREVNMSDGTMTLDKAPADKKVAVRHIEGGWGVRRKINNMGIHTGDSLIVRRSGAMGGPILIRTSTGEVAVGRGLAGHLVVEIQNES